MRTLTIVGQGVMVIRQVPVPDLEPDTVLITVKAIALNPTDWYYSIFPCYHLGAGFINIRIDTQETLGLVWWCKLKNGMRLCWVDSCCQTRRDKMDSWGPSRSIWPWGFVPSTIFLSVLLADWEFLRWAIYRRSYRHGCRGLQ